ncbi:2-oxoacid:acceptor oxidoreductase subunit alpha [Candidatus Roizmanbacteria bacterium]|nr:2-oxoacid:acceptor oxidoreductase subunit alpha [Candidatus Roizmanbacteria bacterium]
MSQYLWKIGGEAGFGILTTGTFFSKIASRLGYFIFDYIQYPSLIRGGHNTYNVGFSDEPVYSLKQTIDMLVCLNKDTYTFHKDKLGSGSLVLYDKDEFEIVDSVIKIHIPLKKTLSELKGQVVMKNTIALGASLALLGADIAVLYELLMSQFGRKGEAVVNVNKQFAEAGYNYVLANYKEYIKPLLVKRENPPQLVISGNETFSLAASVADCRLYVAYPMTPSSTVLTVLAGWQGKTNMVVRHAEDEISVINTALGGSLAGVRSSVGTSGGGFALMVESISFAGIAEIPLVIFLAQRSGPATGMPTWTEQGDLLFAVHAGHGEFPKIVLAPGDNDEMFELTIKAFDLADIYQVPVIVMSDMLLSESHRSLSKGLVEKHMKEYKPNRGKQITAVDQSPYLRYRITDDGISPHLIPGAEGAYYQSNSYEHLEDGHTTEEALDRIHQVDKRARKTQTYLKSHFSPPKIYGDMDGAEIIFVAWGSTKGPVQEAQRILQGKGIKTALLHFTHMFPMDKETVLPFFNKEKRYILVENNSTAQFGKLLRMELSVDLKETILKYDGRPISMEEIVNFILK